jgi:hypothetical protein
LGYFGTDGTVDLSVVIRTAVANTIDSSPVEELAEAALKARTVLDGHATVVGGSTHRSPGDPINSQRWARSGSSSWMTCSGAVWALSGANSTRSKTGSSAAYAAGVGSPALASRAW